MITIGIKGHNFTLCIEHHLHLHLLFFNPVENDAILFAERSEC